MHTCAVLRALLHKDIKRGSSSRKITPQIRREGENLQTYEIQMRSMPAASLCNNKTRVFLTRI